MRGKIERARCAAGAIVLAVLLAAFAGCAGPPEPVPVPTFPGPESVAGVATGSAPTDVGIPDDCERLMPAADLVALLGLPLDSVAVRTTIGVPEPSVGRVERVACRYTGTLGRAREATLLDINAGRYVDEASATRQWRVNANAESGPRREVPFGIASALVIERPDATLLSVTNRDVAVTLMLPAGAPRPPGRSATDTLVDLALRVLAVVTPPQVPDREPSAAG